jgi:hypothetical protein
MSMMFEEFEVYANKHNKSMLLLDIQEDLIKTLFRLSILNKQQYRDTISIHSQNCDMQICFWHAIKDEYYNNML